MAFAVLAASLLILAAASPWDVYTGGNPPSDNTDTNLDSAVEEMRQARESLLLQSAPQPAGSFATYPNQKPGSETDDDFLVLQAKKLSELSDAAEDKYKSAKVQKDLKYLVRPQNQNQNMAPWVLAASVEPAASNLGGLSFVGFASGAIVATVLGVVVLRRRSPASEHSLETGLLVN